MCLTPVGWRSLVRVAQVGNHSLVEVFSMIAATNDEKRARRQTSLCSAAGRVWGKTACAVLPANSMRWGPGCRHCFQVDLGPSRAPTDPPTTPTRDRLDVISKLGFWCRGSRARTKHGLSFPKLFHAED